MSDSDNAGVRLHHVGVAVNSLDRARQALGDVLGLGFAEALDVAAQTVRVAFMSGAGPGLELIEATAEKSPLYPALDHPIKSFIDKHGEGLHHICFEIECLDTQLEALAAKGIRPIADGVLEGSNDGRVAFLNPKSCAGLLIELRERKSG